MTRSTAGSNTFGVLQRFVLRFSVVDHVLQAFFGGPRTKPGILLSGAPTEMEQGWGIASLSTKYTKLMLRVELDSIDG